MGNRWVPVMLIALLLILHGQLWFGRGSIPDVARLSKQLEEQKQLNAQALQANERLEAEIHDLKAWKSSKKKHALNWAW